VQSSFLVKEKGESRFISAMAVLRNLAPLLLLVTVSAVPAALASRVGTSDSLNKACAGTVEPSTCVNVLKSNPESATASPRRLAELAFLYLLKDGPLVVAECKSRVAAAATKDEETRGCLGTLYENISGYVDYVTKLAAPEQGEAQFAEAKNELTDLLAVPSDSGVVCSEAVDKAEPVTFKIDKYERMLQITLDLMNAVAPSKDKKEI
jgi:pectinesterase inhibitor-like protein